MCCSLPDFLLVVLSIIFPPFGALLRRGCGTDFLINCGLTALGYLPGLIHAWYLICKYPAHEYEMLVDDEEGPRHHVVIISSPAQPSSSSHQDQAPPPYQATQGSKQSPTN